MNLKTQRWVDRYIGQILCAALSLGYKLAPTALRNQPASSLLQHPIRNIAVLMLSEMGSMVLAQPMICALKACYPQAHIHVIQLGKNQEIAKLLAFTDEAHLHAIDDASPLSLLKSLWRLVAFLRRIRVDAVIDCELFARISSCIAALSGAPLLAGFTRHTQEGLYRGSYWNCGIPYNPYQHISDQFLALARALEKPDGTLASESPRNRPSANAPVDTTASLQDTRHPLTLRPITVGSRTLETFRPAPLALEEGERPAMTHRLLQRFPQVEGRPLVLMYPGGGILPIRAWPPASFTQCAKTLLEANCAIGFIGLPADKPLATQLLGTLSHPAAIDLTGYTPSIRELLVLFHYAKVLITNDGGPGHFAALTPIHTVMLFGPETPLLYAPLKSAYPEACSHTFYTGIACSPCLTAYNHRESFCDGDNVCLQSIEPQAVAHKALSLLGLKAAADAGEEPQA